MPNLGQIRRFLEPCDLEIWRMTLKNNRAPLLSIIKLYASFHHHMWIQTGVIVRKRLSWVVTSVTLTFDLWPWPFAWTSLLSLVITPENFMIRWWEHSQKGVTDGRTDRQTENTIHRAAWSQLKKYQWDIPYYTLKSIVNKLTNNGRKHSPFFKCITSAAAMDLSVRWQMCQNTFVNFRRPIQYSERTWRLYSALGVRYFYWGKVFHAEVLTLFIYIGRTLLGCDYL